MSNRHILIVNPDSGKEYLSEQFKLHDFRSTAIFTFDVSNPPSYYRANPNLFYEQIFVDSNDPIILQNSLKDKKFDYIVNGIDRGTEVADRLTELMLPQFANSSKSSAKRFNKYVMMQSIESSGLSSIMTRIINAKDFNENEFNDLHFPVFCKPNISFASVGSFKADSKTDLINRLKFYAKNFDDYLIQEYLEGHEYIVDAFSLDSAHYISSVSHCKKEYHSGLPIYRYIEIENNKTSWDKCESYIPQALSALEVKNGFTHNEIMMDRNGDLKLIELNNCISGLKGAMNKMSKMCGLIPQDAILANFLNKGEATASGFNKMTGFARSLCLFNFTDGTIIKDPREQLKKFESVTEVIVYKNPGDINKILGKIDLTDIACLAILYNPNYQKLEQDSIEIFELERQGLLI